MVTAHIPIGYEFEHGDTKIVELVSGGSVYALIAGDILRGSEVINVARTQLLVQREGDITASETAEIVRNSYQQVRRKNVVHRELEPRGLTLDAYYRSQQQLSQQIVQLIDRELYGFEFGVEMLIAGPSGHTHTVHTISNPGIIHDNSSIGHGAIGSGAPHALYSLIEGSYLSSMERDLVVDLVKKAKPEARWPLELEKKRPTIVLPREETSNG